MSKLQATATPLAPAIQRGQGFAVNAVELPEQAGALPEPLQVIARNYIGARRRSGDALLEAARWLHEARTLAKHGEWRTFLEATQTSSDTAERLINIHLQAAQNPQFADAVARNWLSQSAAALLARPSTPPEVISEVLEADQPPKKKDVEHRLRTIQNPHSADFEPEPPAPDPYAAPAPDEEQALITRIDARGWAKISERQRGSTRLLTFRNMGSDEEQFAELTPNELRSWADELDRTAERRAAERAQQVKPLTSAEITDRLATQTREANRGNPAWQYTHDDPEPDDSSVYVEDMRPPSQADAAREDAQILRDAAVIAFQWTNIVVLDKLPADVRADLLRAAKENARAAMALVNTLQGG